MTIRQQVVFLKSQKFKISEPQNNFEILKF